METMSMIDNDWLPAIQDEFKKDYYRDLYRFVKEEYSNTVIYPPAEDIFNAFHFTPLSKVKVLLLGQDPYHNCLLYTSKTADGLICRWMLQNGQ